ncbi:4Fe-4S binding protein [Thiobacillus sp.]|uniref:4Fe-4S binding protein n=1 Tax=Thiobacillus sp. TaxID=924 RepID=UPI00286DE27B|nr:4Fe-4S binding protein [Thiobacillus sp.]
MNPVAQPLVFLPPQRLARLGLLLRRHQRLIMGLQWSIVLAYVGLVAVPAFLPLPPEHTHLWDNLTRFAQFAFWGIWWPFVILSTLTLGRVWCGVLCPEGALTEWASRYGLGRGMPKWLKWGGWPFLAFVSTTVFGQMTSIYEYPKPVLLILGGSTLAAVAAGLIWGREKRVWCRHLCPVSGVFSLLAKVAPLHYRVDQQAWDSAPPGSRASRTHAVNCAPLINIRRMDSASACHMCGRCAGERDAVQLSLRRPDSEILASQSGAGNDLWAARLLAFGMLGVALGAFQWSASPWLVTLKQALAEWLVEHEIWWALDPVGLWWLFTDYPEVNDVFTWLDGGVLLAYIAAETLVVGGWVWGWLKVAGWLAGLDWTRMAYTLIPFAGISVFVGLSLLTTGQLAAEGVAVPWAGHLRIGLLGVAALWGASLAWRLAPQRRLASALTVVLAAALPLSAWAVQFFVW